MLEYGYKIVKTHIAYDDTCSNINTNTNTNINTRYFSCYVDEKFQCPVYSKEYFINKWTEKDKDKGALAVFNTKDDALDFILANFGYNNSFIKFFKCKYVKSKLTTLSINLYLDKGSIISIGSLNNVRSISEEGVDGTVYADKVMLLKEINY